MSRIFRNQQIYEQVFYDNEAHYEEIVRKFLQENFPDFVVVDFEKPVLGEEGIRRKADLALIHNSYKMWIVVEVELAHHSLENHVFPQMTALATGDFQESHADYLVSKNETLDAARLKNLISYNPPEVAVIVNSRDVLSRGWRSLTSELGVELSFLEVYRSELLDHIIFFSGYEPRIVPSRIAGAKKSPYINALICRNPENLPVTSSQVIQMYHDGQFIAWQAVVTADQVMLQPTVSVLLRDDRNYEIRRHSDGRLDLVLL